MTGARVYPAARFVSTPMGGTAPCVQTADPGSFVRVVFGDFTPAFFNNVGAPHWAWVTDHTFRY
jgi:hypothetical protein